MINIVITYVIASSCLAGTYYVARNHSGASDSNPGTESQPWLTIQHAANVINAGDICLVKAGAYYERIQITRSGKEGSPIIFQAQGTVVNRGFTIEADYIHVIGFEITDTPNDFKDGQGVWLIGKYCEIKNNYLHDITRWGILMYYIDSADDPATSHCLVSGNRIERASMAGIEVWGQNNIIENNDISHTLQYSPKWIPPPSWVDADGMRFFGKGHIIRGNYIHDITFDDPENIDPHTDGIQTWGPASDILIDGNYIDLPMPPSTTSCQFLTCSGSNPMKDITLINNIFITDSYQRCPITLHGTGSNLIQNVNIIHNTFIRTADATAQGVGLVSTTKVTIKNNIFYYHSSYSSQYIRTWENVTNLDVGYNLVFVNAGNPAGNPYPKDLWQVDPMFVKYEDNDFRLQQFSPAIDAAAPWLEVIADFDNNNRPQGSGYDIGAFEFNASGSSLLFPPQNFRAVLKE